MVATSIAYLRCCDGCNCWVLSAILKVDFLTTQKGGKMDGTRDAKGHFIAGKWRGGPGRSKAIRTDYRAVFEKCLTEEALFRIVDKAVADAIEGDARARQWVVSYVLPPVPKVLKVEDATTVDRSKMDRVAEKLGPEELEAWDQMLAKVEAEVAND
jgi:hypothetical protein